MAEQSVLVVEDTAASRELVPTVLGRAGFDVRAVGTGAECLEEVRRRPPDLIVLDLGLPDTDGTEVCRQVRAETECYVLMLTARAEEVDKVLGLEVGADDYLTKPFSMRELLARARALLRRVELMTQQARTTEGGPAAADVLVVGELCVDVPGRTATLAGTPLDLTPKEYDLLHMLASQPGRAYSREYLLQRIWGLEYDGFDRTVDTHIVRLRKKLGPMGDRIATVWGVGYKLRAD